MVIKREHIKICGCSYSILKEKCAPQNAYFRKRKPKLKDLCFHFKNPE